VIVRLADLQKDGPEILRGARDFISRMPSIEGLPENDNELSDAIAYLVAIGLEIIVVEHEGRIVAGLGSIYAPFVWNRKHLNASEMFMWGDGQAPPMALRALLRFYQKRKQERGVRLQDMSQLSTSPNNIEKLYRAMGLKPVQTLWMGAA
jgi:hypothetical protein